MNPAFRAEPITNLTLRCRATGKMLLRALAWSTSEYWDASKQTSGSASCMTLRMGSGVFTPMPQPLMIPSAFMRARAGNAPLSATSNCCCQGVGSSLLSDEMSCTNTISRWLTPSRCRLSSTERRTPSRVQSTTSSLGDGENGRLDLPLFVLEALSRLLTFDDNMYSSRFLLCRDYPKRRSGRHSPYQ